MYFGTEFVTAPRGKPKVSKFYRWQVILKWRFDWAGPPSGLVERLIASCRVIGKVEHGLCWRYGAVFKSHAMASGNKGKTCCFICTVVRVARNTRRTCTLSHVRNMFGPVAKTNVLNTDILYLRPQKDPTGCIRS